MNSKTPKDYIFLQFIAAFAFIGGLILYKNINGSWIPAPGNGPIGDLIAGTLGVAISLCSVILIYVTFKRQNDTNKAIELNFYELRLEKSIERLQVRLESNISAEGINITFREKVRASYSEVDLAIQKLTSVKILNNSHTRQIFDIKSNLQKEEIKEFGILVITILKSLERFERYDKDAQVMALESFLLILQRDELLLIGILFYWGTEKYSKNKSIANLTTVIEMYKEKYGNNDGLNILPIITISTQQNNSEISTQSIGELEFIFTKKSDSIAIVKDITISELDNNGVNVGTFIFITEQIIEKDETRYKLGDLVTNTELSKIYDLFTGNSHKRSFNVYLVEFSIFYKDLDYIFNFRLSVDRPSISSPWTIMINENS